MLVVNKMNLRKLLKLYFSSNISEKLNLAILILSMRAVIVTFINIHACANGANVLFFFNVHLNIQIIHDSCKKMKFRAIMIDAGPMREFTSV